MPTADFRNAESIGTQIHANAILGRLLRRALAEGLPSRMAWEIGDGRRSVTGRCRAVDPCQRLADWQKWLAAVGASPETDAVIGGIRRLAATNPSYDGIAPVQIVADIVADDAEQEEPC
jgi:hypothetical protein